MKRITELPKIPPRQIDAHKGSFGKVLIIGGSRGMSGAPVLSGSASLRAGAGLVQVAVPSGVQDVVAVGNPCFMTVGLAQDDQGRLLPGSATEIEQLATSSTVLAVGPGLGQSATMPTLIAKILSIPRPILLDADALNALVQYAGNPLSSRTSPTLLTPHPGEFSRLVNRSTKEVQADRENLAIQYAQEQKVILILKGHGTLVTDGDRLYRNITGNPGMATAGSGDVLTGIIAAFLAQGLEPFAAAQLGVFIHGRAGDLAANDLGEISLIATDLIDALPEAILSLNRSE